mmetsp:Transcript_23227/g.67054  ORF Transcript_23227/g.67054 Transcript_23227/m.67054 type:complete len:211 (-) Transcript_23227:428-1060(-)
MEQSKATTSFDRRLPPSCTRTLLPQKKCLSRMAPSAISCVSSRCLAPTSSVQSRTPPTPSMSILPSCWARPETRTRRPCSTTILSTCPARPRMVSSPTLPVFPALMSFTFVLPITPQVPVPAVSSSRRPSVSARRRDPSLSSMRRMPLSSEPLAFPNLFMRLKAPRRSLLSAILSPSMLASLAFVLVGLSSPRISSSATVLPSAMTLTAL